MPSIYPYSLDPEKYAEYKRRYVRVPTWETFNNLPQFAILRSFTQQNVAGRYGNIRLTDIQEKLDAYVDACGLGTVVWPHTHTVWAENFPELVEEIKKRGLYLFDIWSYRPGYMRNGTLSNWRAPAGMPESLVASLGDHFLGFDNGEQDGRYVSQYGRQQCPSPTEGPRQLQNFLRHFGGLWDNLGNQITTLISLNYIHYFLKEGNHLLGGAETAQSLPNSQIYYAFIRGAGKQYGIHWFGNVSVWNRRGWKVYFEDDEIEDRRDDGTRSDGGPRCGAQWGTSLSLLKRNMYTHWMYDSVILGFENSWFRKSNPSAVTTGEFEMGTDLVGGPEALSPIGIIQAEAKKFVEKHGRPGAMHTPLAVIIDFFAGWTVPRHLYTKNVYQVWGARPYSPQDYFVHGMLSQVYPGYENSGFFEDERGYLTETPYGDIVDCLLSDVRLSVLGRYSLILCAAGYDGDVELADKLSAAASRGATVFLSGAGASRLFPGWCIQEADHMDAGSVVEVDGGGAITEQYGFSLLHASSLPQHKILARCGNRPAAVEVRYGDGAFIVSLSPFCLSDHAPEIAIDNVPNLEIPNPRPLLQHVRVLLDRYLKEERIFTVGDGLGYTVCRKDERRYIVAIYNNGFEAKEISLRCQCGEIAAIDELLLDQSEKNAVGYRPRPFQDREYAKEGADTLSAGDIRIFDVKITKEKVHVLQEMPEEATPAQRYLRIDTESGLQQSIRNKPTLYDYFSGVEIDWRYLDNRDLDAIRNEGRWLQRQSFEVIIDFSSGCNIFPDLAYLDSAGIPYYETLERVETLFRKAATLSTSRCILSLHRAPNVWSEERLWNTFLAGMHEVCRRADEHGITVLLQHHHAKWPGKSENVAEFIRSAKVNNLKFALNLSHCMLTGENPENLMAGSLDILGAVLLSVPETDAYGQRYDAHLPAYRFAEEMAAPILASHAADHDIPLVLDASYSSWDDVYRDVRFLGLAGE